MSNKEIEISEFVDPKGNKHPTLTLHLTKYKKITFSARNWALFVNMFEDNKPHILEFIEANKKLIEALELRQFMDRDEYKKYLSDNKIEGIRI